MVIILQLRFQNKSIYSPIRSLQGNSGILKHFAQGTTSVPSHLWKIRPKHSLDAARKWNLATIYVNQ